MSDVGAKRGRDVAEAGDSVPPGRAAASFADAADECVHGEAEDVPTAAAPPAVVTAQKPVAASTACEPTSKRGRAHSDNEGATGIRALTSALVQVGDGTYMGFEHEGLKELHCATLLQALLASSVFGGELPAMSLGRCSVYVGHTASKKKPTADEEAAAAADPLEGLETLGDRAAGLPPKANLFIRVQLPAAAAPAAVQGGSSLNGAASTAVIHCRSGLHRCSSVQMMAVVARRCTATFFSPLTVAAVPFQCYLILQCAPLPPCQRSRTLTTSAV